jgi:uncharacterized surface protein with fasciclin (FAS1) repeats
MKLWKALAVVAGLSGPTSGMVIASTKDKPQTIVDVAVGVGSFKTLVTALKEADLVSTLSGTGPFTVFAPTDEAFAKIPKATLEALLADKAALKSVLTYHVVAGKVMASDAVKLRSAKTVAGAEISIDASNGVMLNGGTKVIKADIAASNGVIHVIDTVLMPPAAGK